MNLLRASCGALMSIGWVQGCDSQVDPTYQGEPLATLKGRVSALASVPAAADVGVLWLADSAGDCSGPEPSCSYMSSGTYSPSVEAECPTACGEMPECAEVEAIEAWESCQQACGVNIEVAVQVEYHACATGGVGQTAPVVGGFPAQFSLDMLEPPPNEALLRSETGERIALGWLVALAPNSGELRLGRNEDPPAWLLGGSETHVLVYAADAVPADSRWGAYLGGEYAAGYHLVQVVFGTRCGLPRLDHIDDPDSDGESVAPTTDPATSELPPVDTPSTDPNYAGVPLVCGNGVCDPAEDCEVCSDCVNCSAGSAGESSGRSNLEGDYFCTATPATLRPSLAGAEADIELFIAPADRIDWPAL